MNLHTHKGGVFAIIFDERKRILLCHRNDLDIWNLPGGSIEEGEAPWEAAIRETKEEVGLDIEVEYLSGVYYKPLQNENGFAFVCKIVGGKETLTDEADQIEYFDFDQIPNNTRWKQIERIKDALENTDRKTLLKIQRGGSDKREE